MPHRTMPRDTDAPAARAPAAMLPPRDATRGPQEARISREPATGQPRRDGSPRAARSRAPGLPAAAGIGFKPEHFEGLCALRPPLGFLEVHAENYMGEGGPPHAMLRALRADFALSLHGVGLSIGGALPPDRDHLARLRALCDRYDPESFSEHLAWSSHDEAFLNDLLPLPYTAETLALVCDHVDRVQEALGRRMLLENPSSYLRFESSTMAETAFLAEVARRTGCGLLLDVNNVFVSATNLATDPRAYLADFPLAAVGEVHLGGHAAEALPSEPLLIDAHGTPVADPVWTLYAEVIARAGPLPTLIEWDNDVPALEVLLAEAARAAAVLAGVQQAGGTEGVQDGVPDLVQAGVPAGARAGVQADVPAGVSADVAAWAGGARHVRTS